MSFEIKYNDKPTPHGMHTHTYYEMLYVLSGDERLLAECLTGNEMYAPLPGYAVGEAYTLLRSPHIARNEEALAAPMKHVGPLREKYLSHLGYVLMVDSRSLIPERLGGADYDGDMIKTIADALLNTCVRRGYANGVPPLLKIPAAQPLLADARDWYARFQTVKSTCSSRVGQISNAALRRGVIAYDENTDDIVGILFAKDFLLNMNKRPGEKKPLRKLLREPYFVPETVKAGVLLKTMQLTKNHMAMVVDEYGGISGLVTMEDLLEQIVGDIFDEYDKPESAPEIQKISDDVGLFKV